MIQPRKCQAERSPEQDCGAALWEVKARQSSKIREIADALVAAGFRALDEQAAALGLPRSTTWTIIKANHKCTGLSAAVINKILAAPHLHPLIRAKIIEYVEERRAGLYGDNRAQLSRFTARVSAKAR